MQAGISCEFRLKEFRTVLNCVDPTLYRGSDMRLGISLRPRQSNSAPLGKGTLQ